MKNLKNFNLILICLIFLAANFVLNSQPKAINYDNWLFGNKAAITFNTPDSIPIEIFSNIDTLKAMEGISTFSDNEGNVKLVCNAKRLVHFFDKDDLSKFKIFEFENIMRFTSSTNSTIILPSLSNPNQYFVFIVGETFDWQFYNEMYYGIFDISLNNGEGDFTLNLKKINNEVSEKLAVVYDYKLNWYWIATTSFSNPSIGNTRFIFYKLDKDGLNESPIEIDSGTKYHLIGDMKFSKTGKYLSICSLGYYNFDLYKFDFVNCKIENILKYRDSFSDIYGSEFSEDESRLYCSYTKKENDRQVAYIDQFTINDTGEDISKTRTNIIKDSIYIWNMKRGKDNKLYIATMDFKTFGDFRYYNSNYNYLTVLDNVNESVNEITSSTFKFSDGRYPILGIQTTPIILNETLQLEKCTPDLSVYLSDKVVQLGDTFCINGIFFPECADSTILNKLNIYFEYDPRLMNFMSATSSTYSIVPKGDKYLLKLTFENTDFILNQANEFSFCFRSLLGHSLNPEISVYSDESTKEYYNLIDYINSKIEYISCDQIFRQIDLITMTDFEAVLNIRNLSINLSTEEQGLFKFVIVDINGQIVKEQSFSTNKSEYIFEEIFQFDLNDLSSGIYNIRMTSPSGKYYTKRVILVD